jgi:hypothetical protein
MGPTALRQLVNVGTGRYPLLRQPSSKLEKEVRSVPAVWTVAPGDDTLGAVKKRPRGKQRRYLGLSLWQDLLGKKAG